MRFQIHTSVLAKYPETMIGCVVADFSEIAVTHPSVEQMKHDLPVIVSKMGIDSSNYVVHADIARWRTIFQRDFGVKPSEYRSSVEALIRRIVRGQGLWNISAPVDLYCAVSAETLLPMGGYDLNKLDGDLDLRFALPSEVFRPIGAQGAEMVTEPKHVVYADSKRIVCHLWNYRDSRETSISEETRRAVFLIDSAFANTATEMPNAVSILSERLRLIGAGVVFIGIANATNPSLTIV